MPVAGSFDWKSDSISVIFALLKSDSIPVQSLLLMLYYHWIQSICPILACMYCTLRLNLKSPTLFITVVVSLMSCTYCLSLWLCIVVIVWGNSGSCTISICVLSWKKHLHTAKLGCFLLCIYRKLYCSKKIVHPSFYTTFFS